MTVFRSNLGKVINDSFWFRKLSLSIILLAGLLVGLETNAQWVKNNSEWLNLVNQAILIFFVFELIIRISAYGKCPWFFFKEGWNNFDFIVVVLCLLPASGPFAAVLRLIRILRILRVISALPKLQLLTGALLKSFSSMGYVGLLLSLVCYIYGVAGVHLFSVYDPEHFGSLSLALLTLFRVITLDNWSDIFLIVEAQSPWAAILYFITFILLGTMIMLNLVIGVIMNSMSDMHAELEKREHKSQQNPAGQIISAEEWDHLEQQIKMLQDQVIQLRIRSKINP